MKRASNSMYHRPVLLHESVEGLNILSDGIYVDATFGGGGHSAEIWKRMHNGHLYAFDQDEDVRENTKYFTDSEDKNKRKSFTFIEANFKFMNRFMKLYGVDAVDGVIADLGVSSHQIDEEVRGFSIHSDSRLDMRMSSENPKTAWKVINEYEERELAFVFRAFGEIRNASQLAKLIIKERFNAPIDTNLQLRKMVMPFAPKRKEYKYLAQVFQSIRMEVNQEIEALKSLLIQASDLLKPHGRLVVISYHSLEDRLVKNLINKGNIKGEVIKDFYGNPHKIFEPIARKPVRPSDEEIEENNRARSAKLRIGRKIAS